MKKILILLVTICLSSSAFAANWQMVGARSMGMGGTGVATAQGTYAQYYNPALLAVKQEGDRNSQLSFGLGMQGETTSAIYDAAKQLMDMSERYKALVNNMEPGTNLAGTEDLQTIFEGMADINDLLKNNTGILFFNTLYDENASCHIALGRGFTNCIREYDKYSQKELHEMGINSSMIHVDFMMGSEDMDIVGIKEDGTTVQIFKDGNWAF